MKRANLSDDTFRETRAFWDRNPCDGQENLAKRMRFRYAKEPWLPTMLDEIANSGPALEVGCGQATDALYVCRQRVNRQPYTALDCSAQSLRQAMAATKECADSLKIRPRFVLGNAENLPFPDGAFVCVVSLGALHHSPDTERAIGEVRRVLGPDGLAWISLYRFWSPKVMVANALRAMLAKANGHKTSARPGQQERWDGVFGTMFRECFGAPVLRSYDVGGIRRLFAGFRVLDLAPIGMGIPAPSGRATPFDRGRNFLGAQWLVRAERRN